MNNTNYICVYDLETSGLSELTDEVVQIACIMIDPHSLEFVEHSEFNTMVKPINVLSGSESEIQEKWNKSWKAWEVNKKTRKELEEAPLPEHAWKAFVNHVKKYSGGATGKPISAGQNIQGFDSLWLDAAARKYKFADKSGRQNIFNTRIVLDTQVLSLLWYDHVPDTPESLSFDVIRPWLGVSNAEYHDAFMDVKFTGEYLIKFLKLHRHFAPKVKFKGSFANGKS
jgi:DNA polymerase III alpha subunit (gram-positive type)